MRKKTAKRRLQRCWPGTERVRRDFLPPASYSHRQGRTSRSALAQAQHALESILDACVDSVWLPDPVSPNVPRRAEDLLYVLTQPKGVGCNRRGVTVHDVATAYHITVAEALYAASVLGEHLQYTHESIPHHISVATALDAVVGARARLEPMPL